MSNLVTQFKAYTDKMSGIFTMPDYTLLWLRLWVAKVFYDSGRTKAGEDYWTINDFQGTLFEEEYGITFVDPDFMAQLALYMETLLPILLIVGFASRFAALGLLGMTAFIQFFVYPLQFTDHVLWAAAIFAVVMRGAGGVSVDALIRKN